MKSVRLTCIWDKSTRKKEEGNIKVQMEIKYLCKAAKKDRDRPEGMYYASVGQVVTVDVLRVGLVGGRTCAQDPGEEAFHHTHHPVSPYLWDLSYPEGHGREEFGRHVPWDPLDGTLEIRIDSMNITSANTRMADALLFDLLVIKSYDS
ncbi:hypothetical protein E2C01_009026 [Portunus trituberculatus]|uniref:Uncharacterized protein n=1 Tax=Portunus trituberculatus TaxID=210409 RepID=A0A5B7D590_PORTR|nr:hypothetical protein [Portunus trituberculatus]